MKYDITTVYNCISEKTNFISEITEDIESLKKIWKYKKAKLVLLQLNIQY